MFYKKNLLLFNFLHPYKAFLKQLILPSKELLKNL